MKNQALFSSKDESKKLICCLLQFLFGTLRVNLLSDEDQCHNETKWLAMGDHIETHFARGESAYVILQIKVAGYRTEGSQSDGESLTVGQFKMVFETKCTDFCQMVLLSVSSNDFLG